MRSIAAVLAACLIAAPAVGLAQFINETPIVRDGVRIFVRPSATINTTEQGVVQIVLTQIHARLDTEHGVIVDGIREPYNAWNRALVPFFNAIGVNTLSLSFTFDNVRGCSGRLGLATWREGEQMNLGCTTGDRARFNGYSVNGITTRGVLELHAEVRRLRAQDRRDAEARARQAREDSIARARQAAEQRAAQERAAQERVAQERAASQQAAARPSTAVASTAAPASVSSAPVSAEERQRQAEAAETERRRQEARAQAEEAQRAATEYEQRRQELNRAMDQYANQLAGVAMGMADAIAYNRRVDEQARQRRVIEEQQRVARYRAEALTRYADAPPAPLCSSIPAENHPRGQYGTPIRAALSMQSCRLEKGENAAIHRVRVPTRYWSAVSLQAPFNGRVVLRNDRSGAIVGAGQEQFWIEPGDYSLQVLTTMPGEVGGYALSLHRAPRSAMGDWNWGVGFEQFALNVPYELDGGTLGMVLRGALRVGGYVELVGESGVAAGHITGEAGARVYLQSPLGRSRFFAQGTYGYFSFNRRAYLSGIDMWSYETGNGPGVTAGLGWEWTMSSARSSSPGTLELALYRTTADLTGEFEAPFESLRLRLGFTMHMFSK
jgi:hypothetical protein